MVVRRWTRYDDLSDYGFKHIGDFNRSGGRRTGEPNRPQPRLAPYPYLLMVVDELAVTHDGRASRDIRSIDSAHHAARALASIHLVLAAAPLGRRRHRPHQGQHLPSRLAFATSSLTDSRTILDQPGASSSARATPSTCRRCLKPMRVQGAWVGEIWVHQVVAHVKPDEALPRRRRARQERKQKSPKIPEPTSDLLQPGLSSPPSLAPPPCSSASCMSCFARADIMDLLEIRDPKVQGRQVLVTEQLPKVLAMPRRIHLIANPNPSLRRFRPAASPRPLPGPPSGTQPRLRCCERPRCGKGTSSIDTTKALTLVTNRAAYAGDSRAGEVRPVLDFGGSSPD